MYFSSKKVAFSRHESFSLRFGWLTKGFRAFERDNNIFSNENAVVTLGVGKNMVNSIRHWLRACKLIVIEGDKKETTPIGKAMFSKKNGWDSFLEDEATIWLVHWLISTNSEQATAWYWFFNHFHKPEFTNTEVMNALSLFAKEKVNAKKIIFKQTNNEYDYSREDKIKNSNLVIKLRKLKIIVDKIVLPLKIDNRKETFKY